MNNPTEDHDAHDEWETPVDPPLRRPGPAPEPSESLPRKALLASLRFMYEVPLKTQQVEIGDLLQRHIQINGACNASAQVVDTARPVGLLDVVHSLSLRTSRTTEQLEARFRRDRKVFLQFLGVGIALLIASIAASFLLDHLPRGAPIWNHVVLGVRVMLPISIVCIVASIMSNNWLYRNELRSELRAWTGQLDLSQPAFVEIEYPLEVGSSLAPILCDIGYVICAPRHRRIIIEGFVWRHVIRAEDVLAVMRVDAGRETLLTPDRTLKIHFRVATKVELVIGLQQDSLWANFVRKKFGREPLFSRIEEALALGGDDKRGNDKK